METYVVHGIIEEYDCEECGWSVYSGEEGLMSDDGHYYCCLSCMEKAGR